jgi:hypothetical protein
MRRIMLAENVEYVCRKWQAKDAGKWFAEHPQEKDLYAWALKASRDG